MTTEPIPTSSDESTSWFNRGTLGIGMASLLADIGHEVPTALLPGFLTGVLGAPAVTLGLIEGIADGAAGFARLAGGALADDPLRRRTTAVGGYISTAILSSLIGIASAPWQAGVFRVTAWTARGLRVPARNALLADLVPATAYGRAYGFERAMDNLGAICGPLLAMLLVVLVGMRGAILIAVVPGLLAAVAIIYAIRQTPRPTRRVAQPIQLRVRPVMQGPLGRLMLSISVFEVGNIAATLLILRATEVLTPSTGSETATLVTLVLYTGYNLAATLTSIVAGQLVDRWGAPWVLAGGIAGFALAYSSFAFGEAGLPLLVLGFGSAGIAIGCVETAEHAAVAMLAPTEVRGSAFGLLAAIQGFGNLAASSVAGLIWTLVAAPVAFWYLVGWMLLALVSIVLSNFTSAPSSQQNVD